MPIREDRPYFQFNFKVHLDLPGMDPDSYSGGFQEVTGIGMEVTVAEYRNGNDRDNGVRKITGLNKANDVTLKRGAIGATTLFDWLNDIRNGNQNAYRDVTVILEREDKVPVLEWRLLRARIIKHTSGPFSGKGTDVAMEEMVLAYERLELKAR
jgi:phage tail-like protein